MSLPLVLAAPIAITWDRNPATLRPLVDDSVRITLVLLLPAAAAAALIGDDIGELIFPAFTSQDVDHIIGAFLILSIAIVVSQLSTVPTAALFTLGRYWAVALLALPITLIHFGLSLGASAIGTLAALAGATTVSYSCRSIGVLTLVHKRGSWEVAGRFARELVSILLPAVACFGLPALLFRDLTGALADPLAFACGLALYAGTVATLPAYRKLGLRLLRALRRSPAPEGVAAE
jgi:peptidoglycan biosynthesis protein MviN/MurJ (putative lipid II flippase)